MGKLMHAFTIFWAYIAFSQFFLIWYANIPEETQFYAIRNTDGWWYFSLGLVFLHFCGAFRLPAQAECQAQSECGHGRRWLSSFWSTCCELYWMIIPERGRAL